MEQRRSELEKEIRRGLPVWMTNVFRSSPLGDIGGTT
jgi:hypothetical protein